MMRHWILGLLGITFVGVLACTGGGITEEEAESRIATAVARAPTEVPPPGPATQVPGPPVTSTASLPQILATSPSLTGPLPQCRYDGPKNPAVLVATATPPTPPPPVESPGRFSLNLRYIVYSFRGEGGEICSESIDVTSSVSTDPEPEMGCDGRKWVSGPRWFVSCGLYAPGTMLTLETGPPPIQRECSKSGSYVSFVKWDGDITGSDTTIKVEVDSDKNIVAAFQRIFVPQCPTTASDPTPAPAPIEACPGFEIEREIILRTFPQGLGSGIVYSTQDYRCAANGFSVGGTASPGHDYSVAVARYDTEREAEAALGTPNSTFHNSLAVHSYESRNGGFITEALAWQRARWVFRAGSFDDTPYRFAPPFEAAERMHDAAVDLGLFTPATTPPTLGAPTPSTGHVNNDSPVEFVMRDRYALGEPIEIRIRNNGNESYLFDYDLGCPTLKFYGTEGPIAIHTSFHCDVIGTREIRSGEEADLWTWHQYQCIAGDFFRCFQICRVKPGTYVVAENFYREGQKGGDHG